MADQIFTATNRKVSQSALMLNEAETRNPCLVRVVRNSFFLLTCAYCISPLGWRDFLSNQYRDLQTPILDSAGNPVAVDLDWLDFNEADNENFCPFTACESTIEKAVRTHDDNLRSYFSETCCEPVRRNVRPVIHKRKRQRFIDPPPLKWSSAMFRKTEERDGKQATEARRDCHEAAAG